MSTGLECAFIETAPGVWYYLLEEGSAPRQSWDWREFAQAFGPFDTQEAGAAHLRDNHANPGGYSVNHYAADFTPDAVLAKLIAEAPANMRAFDRGAIFQRPLGGYYPRRY